MKKFRKLLAGILTLAMLVTMMPATVMAETTSTSVEVASSEELQKAVNEAEDGARIVVTKEGTYSLPSNINKNLTIAAGNGVKVTFDAIGAHATGSGDLVFENVIFDYYPNEKYTGLQHSGNLVYEGCTINGQAFLYGASDKFYGCTFNQDSADAYNVWTYAASAKVDANKVVFDTCKFYSAGKSVLVYNEGKCATDLTVINCEFNATQKVNGKAAIEIDTSLMPAGTTIAIDDKTTATGFDNGSVSGNSLWNDKKDKENLTVTVAGKQVWPLVVAEIGSEGFTTLAAAVEAAEEGDTIILLNDIELTETLTIAADKTVTLDLNDCKISMEMEESVSKNHTLISNSGNLTIKDSGNDGTISYKYTGVSTGVGNSTNTVTSNPGSTLKVLNGRIENLTEPVTTKGEEGGNGIAYAIDILTNGGNGDVALTVKNGEIASKLIAVRAFANSETDKATINIEGGEFEGRVQMHAAGKTQKSVGEMNITGGTFEPNDYSGRSVYLYSESGDVEKLIINIVDGKFAGTVETSTADFKEFISGGYFVADPSDYVVEGLAAVESDKAGYNFMIGEKVVLDVVTDVKVEAPSVDTSNVTGIDSDEAATLASAIAGAVNNRETNGVLASVGTTLATKESVVGTAEAATEALGEKVQDGDTVTVVVQPYLDVELTAVTTENGKTEMTLEITPMYTVVATTAEGSEEITADNSVQLGDAKKMTVTKPIVITVAVPSDMAAAEELFVRHEKEDGRTFIYKTTKVGTNITFTNPNGFSTFVVTTEAGAVQTGEVQYLTLADAVADAENGDEIKLLENVSADTVVTVSRDVTFVVRAAGNTFDEYANIVAGANTTMVVTELESGLYEYVFNYTAPSSSSKGGSTSKSYTADVADADNGSIRLSREKAKPGTEVTITVTPDKGYKLDELKVLNSRGTEIAVTDNGDGTFTFKMPKGGVEIEASFVEGEAEVTPAVPSTKEETTLVLTIGQTIYQLDGNYAANDVAPIIKADRTFLPIRLVAETLGATVTWSEADQSVTIVKGDTTIVIYIDQAFALVNGEPVELDAPAFIANDRTYLPVRFIAENLGATVTWDAETQTVTVIG